MIAIIGAGTLGSRVVQRLAEQELTVIDHDEVEEANATLQLYHRQDVGKKKVHIIEEMYANIHAIPTFLDTTNIELLKDAEVVVDCTDNLLTRKLLGAYCYAQGIPLVHGAAAQNRGVAALFLGKPCLASLYDGKVSVDTCRSTEIDLTVANKVADVQAELTRRALQGMGHEGVHLLRPDDEHIVHLSEATHAHCTKEMPKENFYVTYCTQHACMSAKPLGTKTFSPEQFEKRGVQVQLLENGEILFRGQAEVDVLQEIAKNVYEA